VRRIGFFTLAALAGLYSGKAQAQTLFDVEHARGNYRAGLVSEYDADLIRMWGAPSGHYPGFHAIDARPRQPLAVKKQAMRAKRRHGN